MNLNFLSEDFHSAGLPRILYPLSPQGWKCPQVYRTVSVCQQFLEDWGRFQWSSLKFTCEFCLCPWLCIFLLRKHTDFCQTFRLRRDADWGGFGWREILFDRFLNHNQVEKKDSYLWESKRSYFPLAKKYRNLTLMCFFNLKHLKKYG